MPILNKGIFGAVRFVKKQWGLLHTFYLYCSRSIEPQYVSLVKNFAETFTSQGYSRKKNKRIYATSKGYGILTINNVLKFRYYVVMKL